MTAGRVENEAVVVVPGTTTVSSRALQRLATGIAKDAARVRAGDVAIILADDRGALRIGVTVPFALTPGRAQTILEDGESIRVDMIAEMQRLAGRAVGAVDVRYSGVADVAERRVR